MLVVVRPVDSEGKGLFRLPDEIRKKREEEDEKLMEKYAQIEANYQAKGLPKLRRGSDGQRRQGARGKKRNGGRRSSGLERSRRKRRGRGKRKN